MRVPIEILEIILMKCDGRTILTARKSCALVKDTIDYLSEKTRIWEWCCREEIPSSELIEYLPKYEEYGQRKWLYIYINWLSWEDITKVIIFEPILCPLKIQRVSCIAVSRNHIAVGSEDGRLRIFNKYYKPIYENRIIAVKLTKLTFIEYNDSKEDDQLDICLVVAFPKGLSIFSFNGFESYQYDIMDIKSHSVDQNYICYEKVGGRMNIVKLTSDNGRREIKEIWFARIYSPRFVTSYNMWNGVCTFLINNSVKTLHYDNPNISPMEEMRKSATVKFYAPLMIDSSTTKILRDNIIISVYKNKKADKSHSPDFIEDYIEILIFGGANKYSKKLFNMWEIFNSTITCIYLYGNTLLLGSDCGDLYFYHVSNWKNLDLRYWNHKIIVGQQKIWVEKWQQRPSGSAALLSVVKVEQPSRL